MEATKGRLRPGGVAFGLAAFAALAALGALAAGWLDGGRLTLAGITRRAPVPLVIAVLGLAVLDYALGGLRLHVWVRRFAPGTPYSVSLRAYLVTLFAGPVSPMSAASGPTQVATLARYGIGPARALAALLLNYIGILTALLTVGGLGGLFLLRGSGLAVSLGGLERSLVAAAVAIPFLLVVALANPRPLHAFALSFGGGGVRLGGRIGSVLSGAGTRLERGVAEDRAALATLRGEWKSPFLGSFSISAFMLLERAATAFLVARALGFEGGYGQIAAPHAVQQLLLYFSPTPGGSGLAEASVPILLGGILPAGASGQFALLWRAVTSYLGIAVGAVTLALVFGPRLTPARERSPAVRPSARRSLRTARPGGTASP